MAHVPYVLYAVVACSMPATRAMPAAATVSIRMMRFMATYPPGPGPGLP